MPRGTGGRTVRATSAQRAPSPGRPAAARTRDPASPGPGADVPAQRPPYQDRTPWRTATATRMRGARASLRWRYSGSAAAFIGRDLLAQWRTWPRPWRACAAGPDGLAQWRYHGRLVARQLDDVHVLI